MSDYLVRGTAANGQIRCMAATTQETAEAARKYHNSAPVVTAALGRLLTAGAMMGAMMKADTDMLTLQIRSDGPVRGLTVTADANGHVKGYPEQPLVMIPAKADGHLDVGGAVGAGVLYVIRDLGLKEPYVGQTKLKSGEIAEDIAYYYAMSEQVPSVVALGVFVDKDNVVGCAGGYMIQLMPNADERLIDELEAIMGDQEYVTDLIRKGKTPEELLLDILGNYDLQLSERQEVSFTCDCSKDRVSKALASIGKKDLLEMIDEDRNIEVQCHFCNKKYNFSPEELREIYRKGTEPEEKPETNED